MKSLWITQNGSGIVGCQNVSTCKSGSSTKSRPHRLRISRRGQREVPKSFFTAGMWSRLSEIGARRGRRQLLRPSLIKAGASPIKSSKISQSLLNQILIKSGNEYIDMAELSPVVASAEAFEVCRLYTDEDDNDARGMIENIMRTELQSKGEQ